MSYNTKNYTEQGGDVTHFGGKVIFEEGSQVEGLPSVELQPATASRLGGVKIGDGIDVTEDGTISAEGYQKPESGIPKSDMADDVKESLSKADTALQEHQSLEDYSLKEETGFKLNLEMDSSTFVITPKMYNKDNELIATGTSVDLPLESVVVSGRYDAESKKIILTLKDGSEIEVPVGDLVDGLVSQADFESHTGDTDVHVSDTDRSVWNGKYTKPDSGIPASDLAESYVQEEEGKGLVEDDKVASYDEHIEDTGKHVTSEDKENWDGKYSKPESGIPKTDLSEEVKDSLDKADTALQEHQSLASYALISETGFKLDLEMDSSTYVIIPKLYDKDNNLISTGQSVDLPLESVVVSGSYDTVTKKVILTLKDGSTIEFSVADLIDGLVSVSTFEGHTGNSTVHVTASEKAAWNGKAEAADVEELSSRMETAEGSIESLESSKYEKPEDGIPASDIAGGVIPEAGEIAEDDEGYAKGGDVYTGLLAKADKVQRVSTSETTLTLAANSSSVVSGTPSSLVLTLGTPASGIDSEYRIVFTAGSGFAMTVNAPTGFTVLGTDDLTFSERKVYEISFAVLNDSYIGCICKEWEIPV